MQFQIRRTRYPLARRSTPMLPNNRDRPAGRYGHSLRNVGPGLLAHAETAAPCCSRNRRRSCRRPGHCARFKASWFYAAMAPLVFGDGRLDPALGVFDPGPGQIRSSIEQTRLALAAQRPLYVAVVEPALAAAPLARHPRRGRAFPGDGAFVEDQHRVAPPEQCVELLDQGISEARPIDAGKAPNALHGLIVRAGGLFQQDSSISGAFVALSRPRTLSSPAPAPISLG